MFTAPLGYLITYHTYGTWLHGDERGSVDPEHNAFGQRRIAPDTSLVTRDAGKLLHPPVVLDESRRSVVDRTIREVCQHRGWDLKAINVRTNHVHAVVWAELDPERVMNAFKSWATRRMVEAGVLAAGVKPWTRHGSTRYLWKPEEVAAAVEYVVNGQGAELPRGFEV